MTANDTATLRRAILVPASSASSGWVRWAAGQPSRWHRQGNPLSGTTFTLAARERVKAAGVRIPPNAQELTVEASVVMVSLPGPADVLSAVDEFADVAANRLVIDLSTIDPKTAREAAARLGRAGARYIDAPVLGRPTAVGYGRPWPGGDQEPT